jgi:hypothetical protein
VFSGSFVSKKFSEITQINEASQNDEIHYTCYCSAPRGGIRFSASEELSAKEEVNYHL